MKYGLKLKKNGVVKFWVRIIAEIDDEHIIFTILTN